MYGLFANVIVLLVLIAVIVGLIYLAKRAWGSKNTLVKWFGVIALGLVALFIAVIAFTGARGMWSFYSPRPNVASQVQVELTPERVERGQHLASFCAGCHSSTTNLPLDGSAVDYGAQPGLPYFGAMYAPNLTPYGAIKNWTDGEIIRAVREGVHQSGRTLTVMPAESFHNLSDEDAASLVAYLRSQPPVARDVPPLDPNFLSMIVAGTGMVPPGAQPAITQSIVAPPKGATAEHGKYLVAISDCRICHGANLAGGGDHLFVPVGPNLTMVMPKMTRAQFIQFIRTGVTPGGRALDTEKMPWKYLSAAYDDTELAAMYEYIASLGPQATNKP